MSFDSYNNVCNILLFHSLGMKTETYRIVVTYSRSQVSGRLRVLQEENLGLLLKKISGVITLQDKKMSNHYIGHLKLI